MPPPQKKNFEAALPKFGAQKHHIFDHFFAISALTPHISATTRRTRIDKPKCQCQSTMGLLKPDLFSVTFNPETAEIRSVILTHPLAAITLQPLNLRHVYSL